MAISGSDGSIILTTKVDETGLKKGFASMRNFVGKVGKSFAVIGAAAATATVAITKMAVSAYADYEQLVGGVETLFKGSAQKVIDYANDAFYTAGVSANEYMQQVTSFSASLIRSTSGDTDKAADIANMALIDISDNVNKMGSSMESVTLAYQGFAKQQYMLLDNLKLGYGGTKTEMERLLKDAQALTGVKYDINNLADVYSAIHAIQEELGITGTTAKEAEKTITGSANMMKAAWQNVLSAIAGGGDLDRAINNLVYSIQKYFENIVPVVERSLVGIGRLIEQVAPMLVQNVASALIQSIPNLVNAVYQMIVGLARGIWQGIKALFTGGSGSVTASIKTGIGGITSSADMASDSVSGIGDAAKGAGKAAKKAGQEAKKSLAAFDDLQIVSEKDTSGAGGAGGGGAGIGDIGGFGGEGFEPFNLGELFSLEIDETLMDKLQGIAVLVGLIGTSLLTWKISDLLLTDSAKFLGQLQIISGWIMIVAGAILLLQGYSDAWANGIDWGNLATTIGGLALLISGIAIAISPMAAAFVAVGGGIALVVLGIKDIVENGPTVQNILTIISGILISTFGVLAAMGKISVFGSLLPILATLAGVFITLKGVTDAWVNGVDWQNFATILAGLAITITAIGVSSAPLATAIALIVGGIVALVVGIKDLVTNGYSMQAVILVAVGAITILIGTVWALNSALLANPITWVVVAIMALVAVFVILWNECEGFRKFWINLWDKVKTVASTVWEAIKGFFIGAWEGIKTAWNSAGEWFGEIWTKIQKAFDATVSWFSDLFSSAWKGIQNAWSSVVQWFSDLWDGIKNVFNVVGEWFKETFQTAWTNIKTAWSNVTTWFGDVWTGIKEKFADVGNWFKGTFEEAWTNIKNVFASWGEFFGGLWDTVKQKFTDFGTKMGDAIGDAVKSGINGVLSLIERTINKAINLINGGIDLINLIPGVSVGKVSHITLPRLAKGAVIPPNREFLAVLGDQKHGTNIEAPLDTIVEAMNIALQGNANYGGGNTEVVLEIDGREFGRAVVEQGNRENRRIGTRLVIA